MTKSYPKERSIVTVTFTDGEIKEYIISAGVRIGTYLAREMGSTGILVLFNEEESNSIPVQNIREYSITPMPEDETETANEEG